MDPAPPRCTAKAKQSGGRCRRAPTPGKQVCHYHGGATPSGPASPHWKHGRYSRVLPPRLLARYQEARGDPDLIALADELALLDSRIGELLAALPAELSLVDQDAWDRLLPLIEARRRLAATERRRLEALGHYLTAAQALALVAALHQAVADVIEDPGLRAALGRRVQALLAVQPKLTETPEENDAR